VRVDVVQGLIKIGRLTLPKYFFYAAFFLTALILQLNTLLDVKVVSQFHVFSVIVCAVAFVSWMYEAIKTWRKWF